MIDDNQLVNTLLEQGFLDQETLKEGLAHTRKTGASLYETLIVTETVSEAELVELVSNLLNVPVHDVEPDEIPEEIRSLVPGSMAKRNRVVPLALDEGELVLGMADPIDVLAMDEVATHTGIDIRPVLVGPSSISGALDDIYGSSDGDSDFAEEVLASFDDFDVEGMMDEVIGEEDWPDFFPEEDEPSVEDSAVLSREMRDRPSTDVLAAEDVEDEEEEEELPEIEIVEELGKPVDRSLATDTGTDLDDWEVDEAITSGEPGDSEIMSAATAEELFGSVDDDESEGTDVAAAAALDDDTRNESVEPISDVLADTQRSKTTVGVGVDHLEDGVLGGESRPGGEEDIEKTGRTELGVGPGVDGGDDGNGEAAESTDYGALGRAILKSKPSSDASEEESSPEEGDDEDVVESESEDVQDIESEASEASEVSDAEEEPDDEADEADEEDEQDEQDEQDGEDGEEEDEQDDQQTADEPHQEDQDDEEDEPDAEEEGDVAEEDDASPPGDEPPEDEPRIDEAPAEEERPTDPEPAVFAENEEIPEVDLGADDEAAVPATDILSPDEITGRAGSDARAPTAARSDDELTRPRLASPKLSLPEGIDAEGLALALANLLVTKDILSSSEIFELAYRLSESGDD